MAFHLHGTDEHRAFEHVAGAAKVFLFLQKFGEFQTGFVAGFGIRHQFFQDVGRSLFVSLFQVRIGQRFVGIVLVRIFRIEVDGLIQNFDRLISIALRERFLSGTDEFGERLHIEVLHLIVHPSEEFGIELFGRQTNPFLKYVDGAFTFFVKQQHLLDGRETEFLIDVVANQ